MELDFKGSDATWTMTAQGSYLCIPCDSPGKALGELEPEKEYTATIKRKRKLRSLDANAYCWKLIDKIAEKMHEDKITVYKEAIKAIGGNSDTVCVQEGAAESLSEHWSKNGTGWITESFPSKIRGCVNVRLYYGSSVYDTEQMSTLIDHLVQDCMALGIETRPEEEIKSLLEQWHEKTDKGDQHTAKS